MSTAKLFDDFNDQYFGGRLPRYRIKVVKRLRVRRKVDKDLNRLGAVGVTDRRGRLIQIRSGQSDEQQIETLLHEMVHAVAGNGHGKPFCDELERIKALGAPTNEKPSLPMTATLVRGSVQDYLDEGLTLQQAQKHVAWDNGCLPSTLRRRFPRSSRG